MSTRIYILAKELEMSNKEILTALTDKLGVSGKTASSNIDDTDVEKIREHFGKIPKSSAMPKPKPAEKKPETQKTETAKPAVKQAHEAPKPHAPRPEAPKHAGPRHEGAKHHAPKHEAPPKPPVHHHVPPRTEQSPDAAKAETIRPGHYRPEQKKPEPTATPARSEQQRPPYQGRTDRPPEQRRPYESRPPQGAQARPPYQSRPGGGTPPQGTQPSRPFERKPYEQRPAGSAPPQGQARPPYQGRPAGGAPQGQGYGTGAPRPATGGYQGRKPHAGGAGGQGQYQSRPQHRPHSKSPLTPLPPRPQYPMPMSHNIDSTVKPEDIGKPIVLLEEMVEGKVPDRFKKDFEADKVEKFKARPGMQRAFQTIRKIDQKKFNDPKGRRGPGQRGFSDEIKQQLPTAPRKKNLKIQEGITVKEFAELISVKMPDVIKKFMELGYMPTINQPVDMDAALLVATGFGVKLEVASVDEEPEVTSMEQEDVALLIPRPPVVTIMGHVDHGKTSLLDAIRETKVTETEAGGITQHIGAYKVSLKGKEIVFLDTPGHEAFTALRARGAKITDIVVLVVAADDGVKPQTVEAINHAKAAGVPIIVAVNKIDKPDANSAKVRNDLAELEIVSEEWGGKNIFAEVSAKKRIGIEHLLEMILLQADMMELKANPDKLARGVIIESKLDKGRGPIATVLVQAGTLKVGDAFLSGVNAGRVRALIDDLGHRSTEAGPSTPVEVIGFSEVPNAGDHFTVMEDERKARSIALSRLAQQKKLQVASHHKKLTLDEVYAKIKEGEIKDLNIIVKADVQGSIEAMKQSLEGITHPEVKVRVIHYSIGGINESDVMLATASDAIIVGFNVRPESKAANLAEKEGVDIRLYNIIYEAIDDVKKALEGMLEPTLKEKILGRAEVRQTYQVSKIGTIAGCMVTEGYVSRASEGIRLLRDNIVVFEGKISTLKRFKDDVKEVQTGYECGITIENYNDLKVGDIIENYIIEKIAAKL